MFYFDKNGHPKIISQEEMIGSIIPNPNNFMPEVPNPNHFQHREIMNKKDGFSVVKTKPYKQSCPSMTKKEEKKSILKTKKDLQKKLKEKQEALKKWDKNAKADVKKWFGDTSEKTKKILMTRIDKMSKLLDSYTVDNFKPMKDPEGTYAQVNPDNTKIIELGYAFCDASEKEKMVTLAHEMSHFDNIGGTNGKKPYTRERYGEQTAKDLAKKDSNYALNNAENYGYYLGS